VEVVVRRPAAALLGTLAGTVLLVGAKFANAPPAQTVEDSVAASDRGSAAGAGGPTGDESATSAGSGVSAAGAGLPPSGMSTTAGATPGRGTPTPGRTTGGPAPTTASAECTTTAGAASRVSSPGVGAVTVTIQVCGGVLKTATGSLSRSNWDRNTAAIPALNSLAVKNYKTDFAAIHYSGATLTSNAYQASLRSAMTTAGV
jgi:hypothetical protein